MTAYLESKAIGSYQEALSGFSEVLRDLEDFKFLQNFRSHCVTQFGYMSLTY